MAAVGKWTGHVTAQRWVTAGPGGLGRIHKTGAEGYLLHLFNDVMRQQDKYNWLRRCLLKHCNRWSGKGYAQAANHDLELN